MRWAQIQVGVRDGIPIIPPLDNRFGQTKASERTKADPLAPARDERLQHPLNEWQCSPDSEMRRGSWLQRVSQRVYLTAS